MEKPESESNNLSIPYDKSRWRDYLPPREEGAVKPPRYEKPGIINLNKPEGISSMDALRVIKVAFQIKKAGHGGTLDPMASGILPVLINKATAYASRFLLFGKTYEGILRLGAEYDTQDVTGKVVGEAGQPVDLSVESLRALTPQFTGKILQVPPLYSAIKKGGKPLYDYARKGEEIEAQAREVEIDRFDIVEKINETDYRFFVACHKGVYVRTLVHDLAIAAGTRGALAALVRTSSGPLKLENSVTLEELAKSDSPDRFLINPDDIEWGGSKP